MTERKKHVPFGEAVREVRLAVDFFVFFSFRFALRASRRSATSWMKTHTRSDSLRFPVIEKTVKQPTRGARADAARDARFWFFPLARFRERFRKRTETTQKRSLRR